MNEELKKLTADLKENKELSEKFKAALERIGKENASLTNSEVFAKAASELGYNVTAAEFERAEAGKHELSDSELDSAVGGKSCSGNIGTVTK